MKSLRTTYKYKLVEKKIAQCESWELSIIWGKMRTVAWDTKSQISLGNCSEEVRGEAKIYRSFATKGR